ncbi:BON domain-containing protein [Coleofasciculus sp. F4-SAH-05]|uniref:BON domain-containing protein n=1 Tax=Coleofasciculus sp. F4-SAH-05 TaxID=3069525 RepID=UPI0032F35445
MASFNVNVAVDNGEVMLTGNVDNLKAKKAAAQDASNTVGVWNVENQINVQPVDEVTQSQITTNVNNALERDPYVEANQVDVAVNNGVATLTGNVDTWYERNQATEEAYEAGAMSVVNQLDVDYDIQS